MKYSFVCFRLLYDEKKHAFYRRPDEVTLFKTSEVFCSSGRIMRQLVRGHLDTEECLHRNKTLKLKES